ncbi:MAG: Arm DNA-binding domain-containing protein [Sphingobacteriaceae bacterium]
MVHVKILLDTRRQKIDGSYPIIYRITQYNKAYTISSGISILATYWLASTSEIDRTYPNAIQLNQKLSKKYFEIQKALQELEGEFSMDALRDLLEGKPKVKTIVSFKTFADQLVEEMLQVNKTGNALIYQTAVFRLILARFLQTFCKS